MLALSRTLQCLLEDACMDATTQYYDLVDLELAWTRVGLKGPTLQ